jgi:uncharacterized protein DUF4157
VNKQEQERGPSQPGGKAHHSPKPNDKGNSALRPLSQLQKTAGNKALSKLLEAGAIKPKLRISQPGDADEVEADRVAEQVTSEHPAAGTESSAPAMPSITATHSGSLHREGSSAGIASAPEDLLQNIGTGRALDPAVRKSMESRFGQDFSAVRIHNDSRAAESARSVNARAFTLGGDIVFDSGEYAPSNPSGQRLLAHELTHVAQQSHPASATAKASPSPVVQRQGSSSSGPSSPPPWLQGVKVTRHVKGNIYEIQLTGYGPTEVGPHSELSAYLSAQGRSAKEQAHHIVGREHLGDVSTTYSDASAPSVALENGTHNAVSARITSVQNELGGRRGGRTVITRQEVAGLYREVYTVDTNFKELYSIADNVLGVSAKVPAGGSGKGGGGGGGASGAGVKEEPHQQPSQGPAPDVSAPKPSQAEGKGAGVKAAGEASPELKPPTVPAGEGKAIPLPKVEPETKVNPPVVEGEPALPKIKGPGVEGGKVGSAGGGIAIFHVLLLLGQMISDGDEKAVQEKMNQALSSPQWQTRIRELQAVVAKSKGFTYYNIRFKILYTIISSPKPQTFANHKELKDVQILGIEVGSTNLNNVSVLDHPDRPESAKPVMGGGFYWEAQRSGTVSVQVFSGEQTARGAESKISAQELQTVLGLDSDTQIRDWVAAHESGAIAEIATDQKIRLINRLLDGWVSDEDLQAVRKICGSVKNPEESRQIRGAIEPRANSLNNFGQRFVLRSILAQMP